MVEIKLEVIGRIEEGESNEGYFIKIANGAYAKDLSFIPISERHPDDGYIIFVWAGADEPTVGHDTWVEDWRALEANIHYRYNKINWDIGNDYSGGPTNG